MAASVSKTEELSGKKSLFLQFSSLACDQPIRSASPFLGGDDEQVVEEEEVDGGELCPHVEQSSSFGHLLQLALLLQVSRLGDDRDGLRERLQHLALFLNK